MGIVPPDIPIVYKIRNEYSVPIMITSRNPYAVILDGDNKDKCDSCGSSQKWSGLLWWIKPIGCIRDECANHWAKRGFWDNY